MNFMELFYLYVISSKQEALEIFELLPVCYSQTPLHCYLLAIINAIWTRIPLDLNRDWYLIYLSIYPFFSGRGLWLYPWFIFICDRKNENKIEISQCLQKIRACWFIYLPFEFRNEIVSLTKLKLDDNGEHIGIHMALSDSNYEDINLPTNPMSHVKCREHKQM